MKTAFWITILVSIAAGIYRIAFEPSILRMSDTYKDLAHVLVGGQIGAWAALRGELRGRAGRGAGAVLGVTGQSYDWVVTERCRPRPS